MPKVKLVTDVVAYLSPDAPEEPAVPDEPVDPLEPVEPDDPVPPELMDPVLT